MKRILFAALAVTVLATPALAQGDEEAKMKAWQAAMAPGEPHEYLARFAGNWNVTSKMFMDPSQPPMETKGTVKKSMILGGRFLQEELESTMMGMPMQGFGLTGYNNTTGKLEFIWLDNMGTMIMTGEGTLENGVMTFMSTFKDPMTKQNSTAKLVTTVENADAYTFTMYNVVGGEEILVMEANYTRAE